MFPKPSWAEQAAVAPDAANQQDLRPQHWVELSKNGDAWVLCKDGFLHLQWVGSCWLTESIHQCLWCNHDWLELTKEGHLSLHTQLSAHAQRSTLMGGLGWNHLHHSTTWCLWWISTPMTATMSSGCTSWLLGNQQFCFMLGLGLNEVILLCS